MDGMRERMKEVVFERAIYRMQDFMDERLFALRRGLVADDVDNAISNIAKTALSIGVERFQAIGHCTDDDFVGVAIYFEGFGDSLFSVFSCAVVSRCSICNPFGSSSHLLPWSLSWLRMTYMKSCSALPSKASRSDTLSFFEPLRSRMERI